jgi:membrane associated rhomboid family serine protease
MLQNFFGNIPVISKNLLILNLLMFVFIITGGQTEGGFVRNSDLGLYYFGSPDFKPFQIVSHMFSHGGVFHLVFNMLALVMFGGVLERVWGPKRFLIFYLITGFGAMFLHEAVHGLEVYRATGELFPVFPDETMSMRDVQPWMNDMASLKKVYMAYFIPTVGASGAIFGLLIAFAMLFPNTELMLMFFPIPIKAKYLVPFFIVLELFLGVQNFEMDNVAHFAHLGGALFGFILVKIWQRNKNTFY